ncbi:hypothetical protein XELAEV_18036808mg [Xenopus laevis]|uniref:Uncharacterized protein n=1 Tax=Xenopus laevis TaxID=8355 RepID=A0A974CB45_XENLA|nr:hypothetical protein XELAEV_18036808mg [Xenopus laevis]
MVVAWLQVKVAIHRENHSFGNVTRRADLPDMPTLRDELLKYKPKRTNKKECLQFMSQFCGQSKQIKGIVSKYWPLLMQDKILKQEIPTSPLFSYTKGKTIGGTPCPAEVYHPKPQRFLGEPKKGLKNIGETSVTISNTDTTVSRHFNNANQNQTQLKWMVLEVIQPPQRGGNMRQYLLQKEGFWIKKLDTLHPLGMNDSWNVKCYL